MTSVQDTAEIIKIKVFLEAIGIKLIPKTLPDSTFLRGLDLGPDIVYVDFEKMKYPGDILHEAGHIAVTMPSDRKLIGSIAMPEGWPTQGDEIAAMLWSFAAAKHLDLPLEFVFHPNGYKGNSAWLIDNFRNKAYIGLPLLEWYGMALSEQKAAAANKQPFPFMQSWMRE
ncbi:hypothetical protein [Flavobacterium pallidum]|uniref:Uncharacterized protein n=1 Tax=Flavobacterium pallidum TaxID=2172098 RepID=A0A2S1SLI9_9FLAO|nr:hypothetical protein [Flavobacterium pallidum]AWI27259.1 hypothetical protein HYN49_09865 [Flavobacterium pallidum]